MRALTTFFTIIFPMTAMGYLFFSDITVNSYQSSMVQEIKLPLKIIKVNIADMEDEIEKPKKRQPDPKQEDVPIVKDPMVAFRIDQIDPEKINHINSDGCLVGMHFEESEGGVPLECIPDTL